MRGGSFGLHTTVNGGSNFLKPTSQKGKEMWITANRKFRRASEELQEDTTVVEREGTKNLKKIANAFTVDVETVICFNAIQESYCQIHHERSVLSYDQSSSDFPKTMTNSSAVNAQRASYGNTLEKPFLNAVI